ncbi:MAG TPA: cyclic lactone autoinducer peptide [Bacteroidetes bacterium]|nr:cyclic lactone autoinducer peptide [Bacteroidota bacterium]
MFSNTSCFMFYYEPELSDCRAIR